jgi:hypothetical protein
MAEYGTAMYLGDTLLTPNGLYMGGSRVVVNSYDYTAPVTPTYTTSGSVLILDASSSLSYPGTGNTWYDISGYGNNGTLTNMAANYTATSGGYFDFPGDVNYYITVAQSGSLNSAYAADFTMDLWFTIDAFSAAANFDWVSPIGKNGFSASPGWTTLINRDTNTANRGQNRFYANGGQADLTKWTLTTAGTWLNWQIVRAGSTLTSYLNTTSSGAPSIPANMNGTQNLILGSGVQPSAIYPLDGKIGFFAVYNRALSGTELTTNYNIIKTRYGL